MVENQISVVARLRPGWGGNQEWVKNGEKNIMRRNGTEIYTFDDVFDHLCSNEVIYEKVMAGLVDAALSGYNTAVCAYGQSGAALQDENKRLQLLVKDLQSKLNEKAEEIVILQGTVENLKIKMKDNMDAEQGTSESENAIDFAEKRIFDYALKTTLDNTNSLPTCQRMFAGSFPSPTVTTRAPGAPGTPRRSSMRTSTTTPSTTTPTTTPPPPPARCAMECPNIYDPDCNNAPNVVCLSAQRAMYMVIPEQGGLECRAMVTCVEQTNEYYYLPNTRGMDGFRVVQDVVCVLVNNMFQWQLRDMTEISGIGCQARLG
ncbi:unnamed protein product [Cylicocyclus nassatus]|uniref:Kinesin motor domain-containing protein n=1 Tax=Cylicocyclus nassatus TaxID=53992 RepID=A0AA36MEP3_CYLNA|nr:unnamed protein product [Cylicocyclus nassatus]